MGLASTPAISHALARLSSNTWFPGYAAFAHWLEALLPEITPAERTALVRLAGLSYFGMGMGQFIASIAQQTIPGSPGGAGDSGSSVLDSWGPKLRFGRRRVPAQVGRQRCPNSIGNASTVWPDRYRR
ncbi:pPE family protein [Mycobacterium kansasii]|uniref:PPE family protein n=1 Tax=Mycobacterium kansasii TaxID=1768 RepID=A0A1V3XVD7_MYCKA|nr:pPE family protein [Mycobacterium kansasii]